MLDLCFLIRSLAVGGAERQLVELVRHFPPDAARVTVLVFYPGGELEADLRGLPGMTVRSLDKRGRWDMPRFLWRLQRLVRQQRPDVIVGCLAVAAEAALLAGRLSGTPVVWRLGTAYMDFSLYDWAPRALFRLEAALSRFPDAIALNSHAGATHHRRAGWVSNRMVVIPQGFDVERFRPEPDTGRALRQAWGVADDEVLVGMPARLDPIKDHQTFLEAAALARRSCRRLRFVCVGGGDEALRASLQQRSRQLGLGESLVWAGHHSQMSTVYHALDVACLTSLGEGLPNVIGEAMACGVPAVVTDVGDLAELVGQAGRVVPVRDVPALAATLVDMAELPVAARRGLGSAARERIVSTYSIDRAALAYLDLLRRVAERRSQ
jgi:glycosyltransferase involved in cell wall biosynthesis